MFQVIARKCRLASLTDERRGTKRDADRVPCSNTEGAAGRTKRIEAIKAQGSEGRCRSRFDTAIDERRWCES